MRKNSFGSGLIFGLLIALIFVFLFNPIVVAASVLVFFVALRANYFRQTIRKHPMLLTFMHRGILLIAITALIWVFFVNPTAALLGLTLPFVGVSLYRKRR